ncbi:MAG: hypothetical protein E3J72_22075 [Planctomycetota bacterium]|nr:MAG: hypothetical protein E3J72_22075 [Planctomycetota bacterium]
MSTFISMTFTEGGELRMRMSGRLTGHVAREGLSLLKRAVELGKQKIKLDLQDVTSFDSIGTSILDWISKQNGNLNIDVIPPIRKIGKDELAPIARIQTKIEG